MAFSAFGKSENTPIDPVTVAAGDARIRAVACFSAEPSGASAGAPAPRVPVLRVTDERDAALAATWLRTQMT